jgi:predicted nucleotidyltransferase
MKYGLSDDTIYKICTVFKEYPVIKTVILYGSRAKGNYREGSDIDLTLKGNNLDLMTLNQISLMLDDLLLPYKFDLSIYDFLTHTDILEHIKRVGIIFYQKQ